MERHTIFLARHGETEWSRDGRHTGRTDVSLTELGRQQARLLGERLARERFALVLSSPMSRALDTCRLACLAEGAGCTDDLREWDYGAYEGRRTRDIQAERPGWLLWTDGVPGGETAEDVGRRADRVLARAAAADGDAVFFAHGHILRVLTARWLGQRPADGRLYALSPATLSLLGWEHDLPVIERWNDDAHLDRRP
ncbi:MAG: histidine phosphatase family protein [Streptosporangiaceae bacterium]